MHSCLNWNYAIKVFDIGKWSQNGWRLASSEGQHSGSSIEAVRYCYESIRRSQKLGESLKLIIYLPPDQNLHRCLGGCSFSLIWNIIVKFGMDPRTGRSTRLLLLSLLLFIDHCTQLGVQQSIVTFSSAGTLLQKHNLHGCVCYLRKSVFLVYLYLVTMM